MSGETCTKCQGEPRAKGSSWGKGCLAQAAKERRMRRGNATDATPEADATASHAPRVTALQVARERVAELEEEVWRLKRELAGRVPASPVPAVNPEGESLVPALEASIRRVAEQRGLRKPDQRGSTPRPATHDDTTVTPHGANCSCLACRMERAKAAVARANL